MRQIAEEAPAEFFKIAQTFGDDIVQSLLEKRLVIRSGARLSLYWDIFRDYILTGKVPYIPTTYVPQANIGTYLSALRALMNDGIRTYDALAAKLVVSAGTADNIVRDLVMIGHAKANRSSGAISPIVRDNDEAAATIVAFCQSHIIVSAISKSINLGTAFSIKEFVILARTTFPKPAVSDKLCVYYAQRILQWCVASGIIEQQGSRLKLRANSGGVRGLTTAGIGRQGQNLFFGEAPPAGALAALEAALVRGGDRASLQAEHGRNAVYVLMNLGLLDARGNALLPSGARPLTSLRDAAARAPTLALAMELIASINGTATGLQLGTYLAEQLGLKWSVGSRKRSGGALKRWAEWLSTSPENNGSNQKRGGFRGAQHRSVNLDGGGS